MLAGVEAEPATYTRGSETEWGYRPYLDGMRAVAVYLVVAYHAGLERFSGGFIGVDVFFVLSGYLVTQVLLKDLRGTGGIGFRRFYARRVRRLLPAAGFALVVTAAVFAAIATRAEVADATGAFRAAAMYFANWYFIDQSTDYFGADIQTSPVIHFWSLSVEEQFYFVWPLLLAGIFAVGRRAGERSWAVVRLLIGVAIAASLLAAFVLSDDYLSRAYYGTDTRAYQLLAGALLACSPGLVGWATRRIGRPLAWGALAALATVVALGTSLLDVWPIGRGALVTAATCALILCMEAGESGAVRSGLSTGPVVYLGRISYGTYLWHWPVIIVATRGFEPSPPATFAIAVLVATGLASISYQLLEKPIRESRWLEGRKLQVIAAGLATSLILGLLVLPDLTDDDRSTGTVAVAAGTTEGAARVPDDLDWQSVQNDKPPFPPCTLRDPEQCTVVSGPGPHLLIMGDSHARMFLPMLTKLARQRRLTLSAGVRPVCPWVQGLQYGLGVRVCRERQADWYGGVLDALDPDVVIVANRAVDDEKSPAVLIDEDRGPIGTGGPAFTEAVADRMTRAVHRLRAGERKVVIIEPVPVASGKEDPLLCLSNATYLDECRFVTAEEPTPLERIERAVAEEHDDVFSLDFDQPTCPYLPICDPLVGGVIARRDTTHLSSVFSSTLMPAFDAFLDDNGILE